MPRTRDMVIIIPMMTMTIDGQTNCFIPCACARDNDAQGFIRIFVKGGGVNSTVAELNGVEDIVLIYYGGLGVCSRMNIFNVSTSETVSGGF